MKIQVNAAARLQAAQADREMLKRYLEELGIYEHQKIESSEGYVSVELNGEEWNTARESLLSKYGRPANQLGRVMFSWDAGKGRTVVLDAMSKPFRLSLIDDN
jgi:hypothetical protein